MNFKKQTGLAVVAGIVCITKS